MSGSDAAAPLAAQVEKVEMKRLRSYLDEQAAAGHMVMTGLYALALASS